MDKVKKIKESLTNQMLQITDDQLKSIREQLGTTAKAAAIGYKLMVLPIPATKGLEGAELDQFETLNKIAAEKGVELATKSDQSTEKETKGSDVGIVVHTGLDTYKIGRMGEMSEPWCQVGDVVIFERYTGKRCELPPGSGNFYHFMDDDDIVGKYEGIEL